jgi:hypothetical protein
MRTKRIDKNQWHKWFAWRTVVIDGWLVKHETVERRRVSYDAYSASFGGYVAYGWEYREIKK